MASKTRDADVACDPGVKAMGQLPERHPHHQHVGVVHRPPPLSAVTSEIVCPVHDINEYPLSEKGCPCHLLTALFSKCMHMKIGREFMGDDWEGRECIEEASMIVFWNKI